MDQSSPKPLPKFEQLVDIPSYSGVSQDSSGKAVEEQQHTTSSTFFQVLNQPQVKPLRRELLSLPLQHRNDFSPVLQNLSGSQQQCPPFLAHLQQQQEQQQQHESPPNSGCIKMRSLFQNWLNVELKNAVLVEMKNVEKNFENQLKWHQASLHQTLENFRMQFCNNVFSYCLNNVVENVSSKLMLTSEKIFNQFFDKQEFYQYIYNYFKDAFKIENFKSASSFVQLDQTPNNQPTDLLETEKYCNKGKSSPRLVTQQTNMELESNTFGKFL